MKIRKILSIILCIMMITLTACSKSSDTTSEESNEETITQSVEETPDTSSTVTALAGEYSEEEIAASWDLASATKITLDGSIAQVDGTGANAEKGIVTISQAGTYVLSGTLSDGQIIVEASDSDNVQIVLNNATLTSSTSSPLFIKTAKNVYVTLAEGTTNTITDALEYVYENDTQDEPNAAIFSKSDLIINGTGTLLVTGNYDNGIQSKDDLKIVDGTIHVTAADDGIIGKDSITIRTGDIKVDAQGDAFKATNTEDTSKGFIIVDGGNFTITSGSDGFQAETSLIVNAGTFNIITNGGSANASTHDNGDFNMNWGRSSDSTNSDTASTTTEDETVSAKALKSGSVLTLNDGVYTIDSSDDSIHSNGTLTINGGNFTLTSGDDGIHADSSMSIVDGTILITKSYEGIESEIITIDGGIITVTASDDGINISGGNDSSSINGRPGQNGFESSGDGILTINGGTLTVDAKGDGLDANGSIEMNGGTTYVSGSTDGGNGVFDYDQSFIINGGVLMAAGSTGMALTPSDTSTQASVVMVYDTVQNAESIVHLEDSDGNEIVTFSPAKEYQFVVISSPSLTNGGTYNLYADGTYSTESVNYVYSGGSYSLGSSVHSFTISDIINANQTISNSGGFGGGMGGKGSMGDQGSGSTGERPTRPDSSSTDGSDSSMTPPEGFDGSDMTPPEGFDGSEGSMTPPNGSTGATTDDDATSDDTTINSTTSDSTF
ncbi:MAG: carbohydrate-binding domain-containing protein [Anaerocolumna sp.]